MAEKRYAIVRANMRCPYGLEETFCSNDCHRCRLGYGFYGDTKEQLIRKVAQARYRQELKLWWKLFKQEGIKLEATYERCLREAKEIVEFLGVE